MTEKKIPIICDGEVVGYATDMKITPAGCTASIELDEDTEKKLSSPPVEIIFDVRGKDFNSRMVRK